MFKDEIVEFGMNCMISIFLPSRRGEVIDKIRVKHSLPENKCEISYEFHLQQALHSESLEISLRKELIPLYLLISLSLLGNHIIDCIEDVGVDHKRE